MRGQSSSLIWPATPLSVAGSTLLTGLKVYYKLDDLTDASGGGATLTDHGTVTFPAGKVGNCAHFVSASSQWLSRATGASNEVGSGNFAFAFWFKTSNTANFMQLINYGGRAASPSFYLEISGGAISGLITDSASHTISIGESVSNYADGSWHLYLVNVDRAGNYRVVVDNVVKINASASALVGSLNSTTGLGLGADEAGNNKADVDLDEVGIWGRVLTTSEESQLWNGDAGKTHPFT